MTSLPHVITIDPPRLRYEKHKSVVIVGNSTIRSVALL